jgi:hypothetical protein
LAFCGAGEGGGALAVKVPELLETPAAQLRGCNQCVSAQRVVDALECRLLTVASHLQQAAS